MCSISGRRFHALYMLNSVECCSDQAGVMSTCGLGWTCQHIRLWMVYLLSIAYMVDSPRIGICCPLARSQITVRSRPTLIDRRLLRLPLSSTWGNPGVPTDMPSVLLCGKTSKPVPSVKAL